MNDSKDHKAAAEPPIDCRVIRGGDWPEDFSHDNGNYEHQCLTCGKLFVGHKARSICKKCMAAHNA